MAAPTETPFWENAALLLSVVQFIAYLVGFNKYQDILTDFAEDAEGRSEERQKAYESLRSRDAEYFEYYCNMPDYKQCDSNIKRTKGAAWNKYGSKLRRTKRTMRGYTPMGNVGIAQHMAREAIHESSQRRVMNTIEERARIDDHIIRRWDAIISAPTNSAVSVNLSTGIEASFRTLGAFGRGVNSAGLAIGSNLYRRGVEL